MARLHEPLPFTAARRDPPYRYLEDMNDDEREALARRLGDARHVNRAIADALARQDPSFLAAVVAHLLSAEFRGVDFIGRLAVEQRDVPWDMTMGLARQAWDEARHVELDLQLLDHYGASAHEFPDNPFFPDVDGVEPSTVDVTALLGAIHLALEGFALSMFEGARRAARASGHDLLDHCYGFNAADEATHVALGDYWIDRLCDGDPERMAVARLAQEFAELYNTGPEAEAEALVAGAGAQA